jgi:alpha-glucosidase (family GH31 glycosyl hydrolase)
MMTAAFGLLSVHAADVKTSGNMVTIYPDGGQAKVIQLEVMNDNIIRVRATSEDELPVKSASLMVVPQTVPQKDSYTIAEEGATIVVKAKNVKAVVQKATGRITFFDANGKELLKEAENGKEFRPYRVPDREIGNDVAKVPEEQRHGLTWRLLFDSPSSAVDESFYGLGQHQSEELNMKGLNEDLFQYNTKVSVPFVLSTRTMVCCGTHTATVVGAIPRSTSSWVARSKSTTGKGTRVISQEPIPIGMASVWCEMRTLSISSSIVRQPRNWDVLRNLVVSRICLRTFASMALR